MTTRLIWNKGAIAAVAMTSLACGGFVFAMGMGMSDATPHSTPQASDQKVELSEPIAEPTVTALPVPTVSDTEETDPEPRPSRPALGIEHFEDGSWLNHDTGEQGCDVGAACDLLPPVPAGEPITPGGGYYPTLNLRPCPTEDAEDCYWDAARMGNGEGTSFIRLDGVTYYPEAK